MMVGAYERRVANEAKIYAAQAVLLSMPQLGAAQRPERREAGGQQRPAQQRSNPLLGAGDARRLRAMQLARNGE